MHNSLKVVLSPDYRPDPIQWLKADWPFSEIKKDCQLTSAAFEVSETAYKDLQNIGWPVSRGSNKRHSEQLAGRLCAAHALHSLGKGLKVPGRDLATGRPLWPAGACGSITHSHGHAAAVAACHKRWLSVGLDLEKEMAASRAKRLTKAILTPAERLWFNSLPEQELAAKMTVVFSAKESLYKALNPLTGTYFGFQDAQLVQLDDKGQLQLELLTDLSADYPVGYRLTCLWTAYLHGFLTLILISHN